MNEKQKHSLEKTAKALNENNINWALGGSALLFFKGLKVEVNDIDICLDAEIEKLKSIFPEKTFSPTPNQLTSDYLLNLNDNEVRYDFIGGFKLNYRNSLIEIPLISHEFQDGIKLGSLEVWHCVYSILQRKVKVKLIEEYFKNNPINPSSLESIRKSEIPKDIIKNIEELYKS